MKEIKRRITVAKSAFSKLDKILRNVSLSMETRLNRYIHLVLSYGRKAWALTSDMRKRLKWRRLVIEENDEDFMER